MGSGRWAGVPRSVRWIVAAAAAVFAYGGVVHLLDLFGGRVGPPASTPAWLSLYFLSLTVLDPLAALLLALRRVEGLVLGCVVLTTDALANGYANHVLDRAEGITAGRIGQAVIAVLAVALVVTAPRVAPWLEPTSRRGPADRSNGSPRTRLQER
ncbi:hypothetical protein [Micromonospora eburnea]|uniref:DUF4267 domain-containing protein n=1 Tax=Micromonospora eburnea TaxID=227316 RepID=A0A1C6URG1_9ACTN|nr:hypothetical protein [Micromonospora eburnea]SCL56473.1 hypothetical protein GA0070604_3420 [Micromonospora eburnea]